MKIVAIAGSQIPSDTANSLQVMKACNALVQLGHDLTLIVPEGECGTCRATVVGGQILVVHAGAVDALADLELVVARQIRTHPTVNSAVPRQLEPPQIPGCDLHK